MFICKTGTVQDPTHRTIAAASVMFISLSFAAHSAISAPADGPAVRSEVMYLDEGSQFRLPQGTKLLMIYGETYKPGTIKTLLEDKAVNDARAIQVLGLEMDGSLFEELAPIKEQVLALAVTDCKDFHKKSISAIKQFNKLQTLVLRSSNVTSDDLQALPSMTDLQSLDVGNTPISDKDAAIIAKLLNLRILYLRDTKVGNETIKALTSLKKLTELNIENTKIDEEGLGLLATHKNLEVLDADNIRISKPTFDTLAALPKLKKLTLDDEFLVTNRDMLMEFRKKHPTLIIPH